jgi:signal transduction histidine kinase
LQAAQIKLKFDRRYDTYQPVAYGDQLKLRQILNILLDNAIQAYAHTTGHKQIIVTLETKLDKVLIEVTDFGVGISHEQRKRMFSPSHTTKAGGHGIGLYVAKRIIEGQFRGTLHLDAERKHTRFIIELPRIT